jgi:GDSL-like Lipase/Acylhydrolase family/FG-GAP repeat
VLATDRPGFVLVMEGTNDATFRRDPAAIVANLRAMIRLAKASSSIPILGAIIPNFREIADEPRSIIAEVNAALPAVAAQEDVRFVNTFSPLDDGGLFGDDRLHPTQAGYNVLAAAWQPALLDAFQASRALVGGVTVAGAHFGGMAADRQIVAGFGPGGTPGVRTFRPDNSVFGPTLLPYPAGFLGGVRVATCDLDGDGVDEIVTGAGPGGGPHVRVMKLDSSGNPLGDLANFFAYVPAFTGGVFVACGDLDGSGPVIVVGAGRGGGPHVRAFRYTPGGVVDAGVSFFAYDPGFAGGVEVAVANVDADPTGHAQIVTGAGRGGGPHVRVFASAPGAPGGVVETGVSFFAYHPAFGGGVHVAAGDLDGDGRAELITGAGPGGGPHVRILRRDAGGVFTAVADFFAYVPAFQGGVFVATAGAQVLTGAGPGGGPHVRGFTEAGTPTAASFLAY